MLRHKGNKEHNWNFTTYYHIYIYKNTLGVYHAPKDFFEDLIVDEVPYIGYQTDNICYYWNCPKGCRSCKKLRNVHN